MAEATPVHPLVRWVTRIALVIIIGLGIFQVTREIGRMGAPAPAPTQSSPAPAGMDIGSDRG